MLGGGAQKGCWANTHCTVYTLSTALSYTDLLPYRTITAERTQLGMARALCSFEFTSWGEEQLTAKAVTLWKNTLVLTHY